jgi:hypothetical protein
MKLSESLLYKSEFGAKIFNSSLDKAKNLLSDIFDLDFNNPDPKIIQINDDSTEYKYELWFDINGRKITALFNFEKQHDDILSEVLRISETVVEFILIEDESKDYNNIVRKAMDYLENRYDIDFIPLDPEEENKNIIDVKFEKDESWYAKFVSENHESVFIAEYVHKTDEKASLKLTQFKHHIIYLE